MTGDTHHPLTVTPAVDYEPPVRAVQHTRPVAPARRRRTPPLPSRPAATLSPGLRAAATFADAALRRVLEVIDRRRPLTQLRGLLAAHLVDSLLATSSRGAGVTGAPTRRPSTATLRRVRVQAVGTEDPPRAAEVVASYRRGPRLHAIACRLERADTRWQVVALHIG